MKVEAWNRFETIMVVNSTLLISVYAVDDNKNNPIKKSDANILHLMILLQKEIYISQCFFFNLAKSVHSKNLKISFFVLKRSILTLTDYISRQRQVLWHFGILRHREERIWILYSKIP